MQGNLSKPNSKNEEAAIRLVRLGLGFHSQERVIFRKETDSEIGYKVAMYFESMERFHYLIDDALIGVIWYINGHRIKL